MLAQLCEYVVHSCLFCSELVNLQQPVVASLPSTVLAASATVVSAVNFSVAMHADTTNYFAVAAAPKSVAVSVVTGTAVSVERTAVTVF